MWNFNKPLVPRWGGCFGRVAGLNHAHSVVLWGSLITTLISFPVTISSSYGFYITAGYINYWYTKFYDFCSSKNLKNNNNVIIRTIVRVLPLLRVCFTLSPFTVCLSNCGDWSRDLPSFKVATKMTVSSAFLALHQRVQRTPSQMRITCWVDISLCCTLSFFS